MVFDVWLDEELAVWTTIVGKLRIALGTNILVRENFVDAFV